MASPASLFALASGRLTPLSRIALAAGAALFLATILLVRPVHEAAPRLAASPASVLLLAPGSPLQDRAALLEGSNLFMPLNLDENQGVDVAQPDASPFTAFGPELRHDPAKPLALPTSESTIRWTGLDEAFPLRDDRPYETLGQKAARSAPNPRVLRIDVFSDINENIFSKDIRSVDLQAYNNKSLKINALGVFTPIEFRLGIDSMGLQSKPYLLRSSGDAAQDQLLTDWVRRLPWGLWLKPGSYRVVIGP